MRHVVIVGATDGIGLALAREYAGRSWRVAILGRDAARVGGAVEDLREAHPGGTIVGGVLDVCDLGAVVPALEAALKDLGQMDLLVYAAGHADERPSGHEEMLRVNTLGAIAVIEWASDYFTEAGGGHLAAIGSVAGDRGRAGNPVYAASKAALHQYLEGMRARLHAAGVRVSTVKPGWVRTKMLGDVPGFPPSISAAKAASLIRKGIERRRDTFYVPAWWWGVSLILRLLPGWIFKRAAPR